MEKTEFNAAFESIFRMSSILIEEYNPLWDEYFKKWSNWLTDKLFTNELIVAIEHVGSTSIPLINCAKPIIDIDIVVLPEHLTSVLSRIEECGFQNRGTLGIPDRYAVSFKKSDINVRSNCEICDPPAHKANVYVVVDGCLSLRNHLAMKKVLSTNLALAAKYAQIKRDLVRSTDDMNVYCQGKIDIISEILLEGGLSAVEVQQIADSNR